MTEENTVCKSSGEAWSKGKCKQQMRFKREQRPGQNHGVPIWKLFFSVFPSPGKKIE